MKRSEINIIENFSLRGGMKEVDYVFKGLLKLQQLSHEKTINYSLVYRALDLNSQRQEVDLKRITQWRMC